MMFNLSMLDAAAPAPQHARVVIVGTGFAGLGMAIKLREAGIEDLVVLERAHDVGGTWRDNSYPGCACDVPSHLYSFSFAQNPGWSRTFSAQPEIWQYLRATADRFGLRPFIRFDHEVLDAAWDEDAGRWAITTSQGAWTADVLISGMGGLSEPALPDIPGRDSFAGTTFHSATWDHDHDLGGERVAVIGTGASAIQFVPRIQPQVAHVDLYQRTPPWIMPRPDRDVTPVERRIYRRVPGAQKAMRAGLYLARELMVFGFRNEGLMSRGPGKVARQHLHRQVKDPTLREKLRPRYAMGCKRVLISNDYYPALAQPNVSVITDAITEITPRGVVTADGVERPVDTIVYGTGFNVADLSVAQRIRGRDGRLMADVWNGSPRAHLGTTVAGFPNLFLLVGPNTGLGHTSMVFMIESQIAYVADALRAMDAEGHAVVEVRPEVQAAFADDVERQMDGTVWTSGCASWYLDTTGRNAVLWPTFTFRFRRRTRRFRTEEYITAAREPATA